MQQVSVQEPWYQLLERSIGLAASSEEAPQVCQQRERLQLQSREWRLESGLLPSLH
jgi:hypothetical protein